MFKSFTSEALPCPEDVKCGPGICKIDPLYPEAPKCECNQGAVNIRDSKCVCK